MTKREKKERIKELEHQAHETAVVLALAVLDGKDRQRLVDLAKQFGALNKERTDLTWDLMIGNALRRDRKLSRDRSPSRG